MLEKSRAIDAGLVFAGYGLSDAALGIDDYAGLDVRGKIVVAFRGTPAGLPSDVAAHLGASKARIAGARGAVGLLLVSPARPRNRVGSSEAQPLFDRAGHRLGRFGGQVGCRRRRGAR